MQGLVGYIHTEVIYLSEDIRLLGPVLVPLELMPRCQIRALHVTVSLCPIYTCVAFALTIMGKNDVIRETGNK